MRQPLRPTLAAVIALLVSATSAYAAATIQITSPLDQSFANPTGGPPDLVEVTYQVTGNTCTGFRSSFTIRPYVNGVPVLCGGSGCGCDGTTESCNNVTKTITLDGNDFGSCLNTIQLSMDPAPFVPTLCITPGSATFSNTIQVWQEPYKTCTGPEGCNRSTVGKPVDVATGKMYHEMVDLRIEGPLPIEFLRRYDSQSTFSGAMGFGWQHAYQMRIESAGTNRQVFVDRTGRRIYFAKNGQGAWDENRIEHLTLAQPGSPAWRVTDKHQTKYEFDSAGKLTRIADRNNSQITFAYTGSNLTTITDHFGRAMTLAYDGNNRIQTLSAGGRTVGYTYGGSGNLTRVDYPDGSFFTHEYSDPGDSHNLTAVRDTLGRLVEGHTYDGSDRVTQTQSDAGNHAYTLAYNSATQTTVTNSRGIDTIYTHDSFKGVVTQSSGPGCASCGGGGISASLQYDRFLNLTRFTDAGGVITDTTYDGKGNMLTRVEAVGTPRQRTWTFTYHPTFNFPATTSIPTVGTCANANRVVANTYDGGTGNKLTEQVTGCNGTSPFTFTTSWTYDARGQVRTVNGPRTDVTDVTTYDYYADGDSDPNRRGRLQRVTNALSQQTSYAGYDLFGNVGSVTDANNVETTYLYDAKDRTTEVRIKGVTPADDIVTINVYDLTGNLDLVRLPNCVETGAGCAFSLDYVYDTVNRLKEIRDPFGNKIVSTYDTEGNRTREESRDAADVVQRFTNFAYDSFNRLQYTYFTATVPENPGSVFHKYTYFDDGTRQTERDPEGHVTTFGYDELKRLTTVTQTVAPDTLTTTYGYDRQDNLSSVTDPNGFPTTYTNGDMGWRLSTVSPDTGTTTYGYDPAGNLTSSTNANGITSTRTYDALDRLTGVAYPTTSLNVAHSYDSPSVSFGIGRRTGMTDPSGTSVFHYDRRELLTKELKTIGSRTYTTEYRFDKTGNLKQVLHPADDPATRQGQVDYAYDAADRVSSVTAKVNGATSSVATSFAYKPFGPRASLTFGNGVVDSRSYGSRYQLGSWTVGSLLNYTHTFDRDLNLTGRTDNLNAANNRTFGYNEIHRLKAASGPWGAGTGCAGGTTYTYDRNGNRLCKGEGLPATTYAYTPSTNRLVSSAGGDPAGYSYDSNGNITGDGTRTFQYNQPDRLATVDSGATATYTYDGDGRRAIKTVGNTTTYFFYDPSGRLLMETLAATGTGKDYLYLLDAPIGRVDWTVGEFDLGNVLRVQKNAPNVRLDWTLFSAASNTYLVRRKQVVNPNDKTFDGSAVIATISDPTRTYDDPVLNDGNRYEYRVLRRLVSESLYFYHTDHLGTPTAMTGGGASFVWRAEHLPFGGVFSLPVSTLANNLRFSGQYLDGETGLHQNWFRMYRPTVGRYAEPDPLWEDLRRQELGQIFQYARNVPTRFVDPDGLDVRTCCRPVQEKVLRGWDHCYVESNARGIRTTWGLHNDNGTGVPRPNDPSNQGGRCTPWRPDPTCDLAMCFARATARYPVEDYSYIGANIGIGSGRNSNTFTRCVTARCGLYVNPDVFKDAPGWYQPCPGF